MARAREIAIAQAASPTATPADRVLYWAYTTAVFDEAFANDAYGAALDDLVASLRRGAPHLGLFGGLANAGWVLCHTLDADDSEDSLGAIDEALLRLLAVDEWRGAHDLIEGLAGFGVYFLERIDHGAGDKAREGLARVITHLDRTAIWRDLETNETASHGTTSHGTTSHGTTSHGTTSHGTTSHGTSSLGTSSLGATWHTPLSILPPHFAAEYPDGFFDCGIAHGVPGMIGMLARASAYSDAARALAHGARRWLEATRQNGEFPSKLAGPPTANTMSVNALSANTSSANTSSANTSSANTSRSSLRFESARTAWCYGDPGIALGLARLAALDTNARDTYPRDPHARDADARDPHARDPHARDTGARNAHTHATHHSARIVAPHALALAALQRDLATSRVIDATLCHGSAGLGHIANRFFNATGNPAFAEAARAWFAHALEQPIADDRAFLDGSAGVGMALVAACTDTEPAWDRLLLADLAHFES
jgi:hypothetical protein